MSLWGKIKHSIPLFRGCRFVVCEHNSGIIITENAMNENTQLTKLKKYRKLRMHEYRNNYYFDDRVDMNLVTVLLNDQQLSKLRPSVDLESFRNTILRDLIKYNADYYEWVTGRSLSIFESRNRLKTFAYSNSDNYFISIRQPTKNNALDSSIPDGMVVVQTENNKGLKLNLLMNIHQYKKLAIISEVPVNLSGFQQFKCAA